MYSNQTNMVWGIMYKADAGSELQNMPSRMHFARIEEKMCLVKMVPSSLISQFHCRMPRRYAAGGCAGGLWPILELTAAPYEGRSVPE